METRLPSSVHSNGGRDTAMIVVGPSTEGIAHAAVAALAAGKLVVEVELLAQQSNPWTSTDVVGSNTGCAMWPGGRGRTVCVRSDPAGLFLVANIDLVLRSNSVSNLVIAGDAPANFIQSMTEFARARGYGLVRANDEELAEIPGTRSERPELLSSLSDRIAPGAAALVLIDVQNDFCAPEGATGRTGQSMKMIGTAVNRIKLLLDAARKAGLFVVHVRAEYGELYRHVGSPYRFPASEGREPAVWTASAADLSAGKRYPAGDTEICAHGSWGAAFVDGIEPLSGEAVVAKHRFSAFADTGLDLLLRARGIKSLVLAGVTTNCCVESTAREAVMRDFYLVVASDCVAVKDHLRDLHDATLETLGLYFGLVRPSEDLIRIWSDRTDAGHPRHATCTPINELKSYP
jgi:nicotinamidase-related amidase